MFSYNARAHVRTKLDLDAAMDALDGYHPAIGSAPARQYEVIITLPAESLRQAATSALAVLEQQLGEVSVLEVMRTETFDVRHGLETLPALVSVTEAAAQLGVSRQAVVKRLEAGTLAGEKVGQTWVLPAAAVDRAAARDA